MAPQFFLEKKQLNCSMLDYQHSGGGMNDVMTRIMPVQYDWVNVVKEMYFKRCMLHPRELSNITFFVMPHRHWIEVAILYKMYGAS